MLLVDALKLRATPPSGAAASRGCVDAKAETRDTTCAAQRPDGAMRPPLETDRPNAMSACDLLIDPCDRELATRGDSGREAGELSVAQSAGSVWLPVPTATRRTGRPPTDVTQAAPIRPEPSTATETSDA